MSERTRYEKDSRTGEVAALFREGATMVDVRSPDAYNGWSLRGEMRGGHVPGARSVPAAWVGEGFLDRTLETKGLPGDRPLVVYGYDPEESASVARVLLDRGAKDVRLYHRLQSEWCLDQTLPLESLLRYDRLVPPSLVAEMMPGGIRRKTGPAGTLICHAHYRNPDDYLEGHVPGAIPLDTLALEEPGLWNRRPPGELADALLSLGMGADSTVVLYGRYGDPDDGVPFPGSSAGQIAAMRCALILMYAGVRDVRVMNGGLMAWEAEGLPVTGEPAEPEPLSELGFDVPARPEIFVDVPEAKRILAAEEAELVSMRSWREFIGEVSGYNYIDVKGRIPGAVFGDCGSDAYHMENFRNPDHTMREYAEIEAHWLERGVTPDKRLAFYCGTGWRASEAFMSAYLLGWTDIAVFDGGWLEWNNDPENPIETGEPEGGR